MSTQRAIFRSLVLVAVGGVALAACYVQTQSQPQARTTSASGANPGYGTTTRDHRTGQEGAGDANPCAGAVEGAKLGQACGDGGACAEGLECVRYYGVAGASGPEFATCERRCVDGGCPTGLGCTTIADGPGQVCRPVATPDTMGAPARVAAAQGEKCGEGISCAEGFSCIEYYGFAGPAGPKFASCEMRCGDGQTCPPGQQCTTISDGPGTVCRPKGN